MCLRNLKDLNLLVKNYELFQAAFLIFVLSITIDVVWIRTWALYVGSDQLVNCAITTAQYLNIFVATVTRKVVIDTNHRT